MTAGGAYRKGSVSSCRNFWTECVADITTVTTAVAPGMKFTADVVADRFWLRRSMPWYFMAVFVTSATILSNSPVGQLAQTSRRLFSTSARSVERTLSGGASGGRSIGFLRATNSPVVLPVG